ncbi:hypothetical protein LXL04_022294 [Taraxacum kok-saghyz]
MQIFYLGYAQENSTLKNIQGYASAYPSTKPDPPLPHMYLAPVQNFHPSIPSKVTLSEDMVHFIRSAAAPLAGGVGYGNTPPKKGLEEIGKGGGKDSVTSPVVKPEKCVIARTNNEFKNVGKVYSDLVQARKDFHDIVPGTRKGLFRKLRDGFPGQIMSSTDNFSPQRIWFRLKPPYPFHQQRLVQGRERTDAETSSIPRSEYHLPRDPANLTPLSFYADRFSAYNPKHLTHTSLTYVIRSPEI